MCIAAYTQEREREGESPPVSMIVAGAAAVCDLYVLPVGNAV